MCFELPEYVHFLLFMGGFLALLFLGFMILQKLMPSERAPYK